nr:hypothetical protein [Acidovorax carolinensis]
MGLDAKEDAQAQLVQASSKMTPAQRARVVVRISAASTVWHADDLALLQPLVAQGLSGMALTLDPSRDHAS